MKYSLREKKDHCFLDIAAETSTERAFLTAFLEQHRTAHVQGGTSNLLALFPESSERNAVNDHIASLFREQQHYKIMTYASSDSLRRARFDPSHIQHVEQLTYVVYRPGKKQALCATSASCSRR